jgi:hypothetical protein
MSGSSKQTLSDLTTSRRGAVGRLVTVIAVLIASMGIVVALDNGIAAASDQTLTVHIYECAQYTNNGVPDLETTTTEISGGAVTIGSLISEQENPVSATVSPGSYAVEATAPGGYYFTDCPNEGTTPTLSNGDQTASSTASVSSSATTVDYYVVPFQTATCAASNGGVTCTLPDTLGLPFYPLTTLLTDANQVSSSVSISTPVVITAYGGNGGKGYNADPGVPSGGGGGSGGEAQTTLTSIANYESTYKSVLLYYYLGYQGIGDGAYHDKVGGLGGSSTIVSPDNFATGTTDPCINGYDNCTSTTNVLALAGGGGGGGQGGDSDSGGGAGAGGTAVASTSGSAYGKGANGSSTSGDGGHGGYGAGQNPTTTGAGGNGGKGGDGADNHSGGTGNSGIGGTGGSMHKSSGPSKSIPWANSGYLNLVGSNGAGGEGEWRGTGVADGGSGSGGGGYGGGGAGGSGGVTDAGGGGGGGGSYAVESGASPEPFTTPSHSSGEGQVFVTFVLS